MTLANGPAGGATATILLPLADGTTPNEPIAAGAGETA